MPERHPRKARLLAALTCALAAYAVGCATQPLEQREWTHLETEHFEFLSDAGQERSLELATEFEVFHSFMQEISSLESFEATIPTRVFILTDRATYRRFGPRNTLGFFRATPGANYVVVGEAKQQPATEVAFHEYSHYIMRSAGLFGYPIWFDEGHADFVSTVRLKDDRIELGRAPKSRVDTLAAIGPLPLRRLLEARGFVNWTEQDVARLYAVSWVFVHYLYFGREEGRPARWAQKDVFLTEVNSGSSVDEAFERAFGVSFEAMERELEVYFRGRIPAISLAAASFLPQRTPTARRATAAEVSRSFADLALAGGLLDTASLLLARLSDEEAREPASLVLSARLFAAEGNPGAAEAIFRRAVEAAPELPEARIEYGKFLVSRALARGNDLVVRPTELAAEQRASCLERGREQFLAALEIAPTSPEANTELAFSYLTPGEDASAAVRYADRAFDLLPSNDTVAIQLAEVLIAAGRGTEAVPILDRLRPYIPRNPSLEPYLDLLMTKIDPATASE